MRVLGPFERKRILPFVAYTTMFAMGFSNMKALMLTNAGADLRGAACRYRVSHRVGVYESIVRNVRSIVSLMEWCSRRACTSRTIPA